jgi:prefoldin subunit 5
LQNQLTPLQNQLDKLEKIKNEYDKANNEVVKEVEGRSATGKIGRGPAFKEKEKIANEKKVDWDKVKPQYDDLQKQISDLTNGKSAVAPTETNIDGVEARVKALYQHSGLHWFVTLLFILIESMSVQAYPTQGCTISSILTTNKN